MMLAAMWFFVWERGAIIEVSGTARPERPVEPYLLGLARMSDSTAARKCFAVSKSARSDFSTR